MKIKDIEKQYPIKFETKNKNKEVDQEELDQLIENTYINQLKYKGIKNIDKRLIEAKEKLKNRTKKIYTIKNIYLLENSILNRRLNSNKLENFIVVEDYKNKNLIYNITTYEDNSFDFNNTLAIIKDKTKITKLYSNNIIDNNILNITYMNTIKKYITNKIEYLEFIDNHNNTINIDITNNKYIDKIYKTMFTKEILLYKKENN